jgi:DNA-binding NarL/FixJ family response regulator
MIMRVLVVDDMYTIEAGVARALETNGEHKVQGVRNPEELRTLLSVDANYQLAFVDLHFGKETKDTKESGLAALETLAAYNIRSVIFVADGEANRRLYLLAAFEFFPNTYTVLSKNAGDQEVERIAQVVASGHVPNAEARRPYITERGETPLLRRLITRSGDLAIWQALGKHTTLSAIAQEAYCSTRTISAFIAQRHQVIMEIEETVRPEERGNRTQGLIETHRFALLNADFFIAPEVERLIRRAWDGNGRARSDAARAGDFFRRGAR